MNKSISFSFENITAPALKFLRRYHLLIFFLLVSIALFTAIAILLPITNLSANDPTASGTPVDTTFDETTIEQLRNSDTASPYQAGNRKSPFTE